MGGEIFMKIIVTGSHGYIGQEVCFLLKMKGIKYIPYDLKINKDASNGLPKSDVVIHLAVKWIKEENDKYNQLMLQKILSTTDKIVFPSSTLVYGETTYRSAVELDDLYPKDAYSKMKVNCETIINNFDKINKSILRLSNVYNLRDSHGIVGQFLKGSKEIYGDGNKVRDFVRLEDVAPIIVDSALTNYWLGTYNISTGKETKIIDIFKRIYPGEKPKYVKIKNELKKCVADNYKATENGFRPFII
jgi:nucleoside-diphosphate-sugar epimerase